MVRQPKDLAEAKQIFAEEKNKVTGSISAVAGSRWLLAILATLVIAFGTHLAFAPTRLPSVGGVSLAAVGLPSTVDFGFAGDQAKQAAEAAANSEAKTRAEEFVAANADQFRSSTLCFRPRAAAAAWQHVDHDETPALQPRLAATKAEAIGRDRQLIPRPVVKWIGLRHGQKHYALRRF